MECVEGALKSSFIRPEMVLKPTQQAFLDDIWAVHNNNNNNNGQNGVSVDDFFVDDLLDFSKAGEEEEKEEGTEEKTLLLEGKEPRTDTKTDFLSSQQPQEENVKDFSGAVPDSELFVPADDLADLEWLSHFVDDSSSGYSLTLPAGKFSVKPTGNHADTDITGSDEPIFITPVQTKARSKRGRTGVRLWSNSLTDSSASSSSSSSYTSSSSPLNPWVLYNDFGQSADSLLGKPPAKKQRKKPATAVPGGGGGGVQPRRCSHCLVQKTPQWRSGPLGAKTLCNACGVRYKSGRLLPEYRPACSPTFSSEIHSNNHRKVLEMRRKKEGEDAFAPPVESF